jgi:hypothetical protein
MKYDASCHAHQKGERIDHQTSSTIMIIIMMIMMLAVRGSSWILFVSCARTNERQDLLVRDATTRRRTATRSNISPPAAALPGCDTRQKSDPNVAKVKQREETRR